MTRIESPARAWITREQIARWSETSWRDGFRTARNRGRFSDEQKQGLWRTLAGLRRTRDYEAVWARPVTGAIAAGWVELNEPGPLFQECLERVARQFPGDWTPAEYLLDYYAACLVWPLALCDMDLGRALRNLPSFIREYLLAAALQARGRAVRIPPAHENAQRHVDLVLRIRHRDIFVWSYLDTPHSRGMLARKICDRGEIARGLNLLAPIRPERDTTDFHGWALANERHVVELEAAALARPGRFRDIPGQLADFNSPGRFRLFQYPDRPGLFRRLLGL